MSNEKLETAKAAWKSALETAGITNPTGVRERLIEALEERVAELEKEQGTEKVTAALAQFGDPKAEQRQICRAVVAGLMMQRLEAKGWALRDSARHAVESADALLDELERTEQRQEAEPK